MQNIIDEAGFVYEENEGKEVNLTRTIVKKHFRGKNSILKFINTNLSQTNTEPVKRNYTKRS